MLRSTKCIVAVDPLGQVLCCLWNWFASQSWVLFPICKAGRHLLKGELFGSPRGLFVPFWPSPLLKICAWWAKIGEQNWCRFISKCQLLHVMVWIWTLSMVATPHELHLYDKCRHSNKSSFLAALYLYWQTLVAVSYTHLTLPTKVNV